MHRKSEIFERQSKVDVLTTGQRLAQFIGLPITQKDLDYQCESCGGRCERRHGMMARKGTSTALSVCTHCMEALMQIGWR